MRKGLVYFLLSALGATLTAQEMADNSRNQRFPKKIMDSETPWSEISNGLQIQMKIPVFTKSKKNEAGIKLKLQIQNTNSKPMRIFLIKSEYFRSGQSDIVVSDPYGKIILVQPPPRPHGYKVSEKDTFLLLPGEKKSFLQTLETHDLTSGLYRIKWIYHNEVASWPGGELTLDGPQKKLFGGKANQVWTGEMSIEGDLRIN